MRYLFPRTVSRPPWWTTPLRFWVSICRLYSGRRIMRRHVRRNATSHSLSQECLSIGNAEASELVRADQHRPFSRPWTTNTLASSGWFPFSWNRILCKWFYYTHAFFPDSVTLLLASDGGCSILNLYETGRSSGSAEESLTAWEFRIEPQACRFKWLRPAYCVV
jgi:hypothetical protein